MEPGDDIRLNSESDGQIPKIPTEFRYLRPIKKISAQFRRCRLIRLDIYLCHQGGDCHVDYLRKSTVSNQKILETR